jgi:hypothetical protein
MEVSNATAPPRTNIFSLLAALVVSLGLLFACWFTYRFAWSPLSLPAVETATLANRPKPAQSVRTIPFSSGGEIPDGISRRASGSIYIRSGSAYVRASPTSNGLNVTLDYLTSARASWVTSDEWNLSQLASRIVAISALSQHVQLTAPQRQSLLALSLDVTLTATERAQFNSLLASWQKANVAEKPTIEEQLLGAVDAAGAAHLEEAKAATTRRCRQISQILSPEQIRAAREYVTGPVKSPRPPPPGGRDGAAGNRPAPGGG